MTRAAIVLLADTETKEGLGRMSNALTTVREFKDEVQESGVELLGDFEGHPSLAKLVGQGYQVITF